ncbi:MAG: phosphotyrosine protein phosphatase [[Chlorobium] sp. 445]|nr:MAG: phosphotyrosine protein phosphatase [[Chlorobium] sp. 445]
MMNLNHSHAKPVRVLFVCLGNICRSPSAEGVFRKLLHEANLAAAFEIDSAGTASYHIGEPADYRAETAAAERGIDISAHRARQVHRKDFDTYDWIIAMDKSNLENLRRMCPQKLQHKLKLIMSFASHHTLDEVPDPYYGDERDFKYMLDLLQDACKGLLDWLVSMHNLQTEAHR